MIVPANNRFRISNKPWSVALANDITTDVSMDYPPFLGNYKGVVSSGLQGLNVITGNCPGAGDDTLKQMYGIPPVCGINQIARLTATSVPGVCSTTNWECSAPTGIGIPGPLSSVLFGQFIPNIPNWWILGGIGAFLLFK